MFLFTYAGLDCKHVIIHIVLYTLELFFWQETRRGEAYVLLPYIGNTSIISYYAVALKKSHRTHLAMIPVMAMLPKVETWVHPCIYVYIYHRERHAYMCAYLYTYINVLVASTLLHPKIENLELRARLVSRYSGVTCFLFEYVFNLESGLAFAYFFMGLLRVLSNTSTFGGARL